MGGASCAAIGEVAAQGGVVGEVLDGFGEGDHVAGVDEEGGVAGDFGQAGGGRGEHGDTAGHGFEDGQTEAFEKAGPEEGVGGGDEGGEVLVGDEAGEVNAGAVPCCCCGGFDGPGVPAAASCDDEVVVEGMGDMIKGGDEPFEVLSRFDGAGEEEITRGESVLDARAEDGFGRCRAKVGGYAEGDDGDAFLGNLEQGVQVVGGALRIGDDVRGAGGGMAHGDAVVAGTGAGEPFGMAEKSEVVDGEDEGGGGAERADVGGVVEEVGVEFAQGGKAAEFGGQAAGGACVEGEEVYAVEFGHGEPLRPDRGDLEFAGLRGEGAEQFEGVAASAAVVAGLQGIEEEAHQRRLR